MVTRILKAFFRYLEIEKGYSNISFYKLFHTPKFESPIIVLDEEKLKFLIWDLDFDQSLEPHLKSTKDVFVVGCTIGLRYSDLIALNGRNIERSGQSIYIVTTSKKTNTETRIKIPTYIHNIISTYQSRNSLLPVVSLNTFNYNLKQIGELAGWTYEVGKSRVYDGVRKEIKTNKGHNYRFCDLLSSHVMRKTAITTLLVLGMPEPLVRKISGHAPNSKEFYRYVKYSQSFFDQETDKVFDKLTVDLI